MICMVWNLSVSYNELELITWVMQDAIVKRRYDGLAHDCHRALVCH